MKAAGQVAAKYALFAVVSSSANLLLQTGTHWLYRGPFELYASMGAGTFAGLVSKYVLDKKYIFYDRTSNVSDEGRKFTMYTATGAGTTLLFWCCEWLFDKAFGGLALRYAGALIGLALGYAVKYRLDRRLVFGAKSRTPVPP